MSNQGGSMKVTAINGVKMYAISGQQSFPTWLPPKKLKALRKDKEYMRRIDLIQDMKFDVASTRIKSTPDGEYIIVSGIYPPQVKVYELRQLSMKFERHLVAEIVEFQVLGDDYSKLAFLCADRSVCLHAKYGSHYSLRIPRMGRDIVYDRWSCDLLCAASSPDLYRINLEQGRFLAPLNTRSPAINVVCRSQVHGLVACGGEDGALECFDLRQKVAVGRINAVAPTGDSDQEVTAVRFDETEGFLMAVGTSSGQVLIYDLRSSTPLQIKDHMYGSPIVDIKWHESLNATRPKIISADNRVVRIWDPETGDGMTSIEPASGNINDVCVIRNSGLMFMALESTQIPSYFIPSLGPAPKWCSYLENLTEELEEGAQTTIYDDFKFVTKEDIERLNLTNLIGTNLLRAYMHGFFVDYRLYLKAKSMADPFAYEAYRQQRIQEKIEAERAARITIKRKLPKVNKDLAARLLATEDAEEGENEHEDGEDLVQQNASKKKKRVGSELLKDERFAAMFHDEEFEVDEFSPEYQSLHPNQAKKKPSLVEEHFEPVDGDSQEEDQELTDTDTSSSEEEFSSKKNNVKQKKKVKESQGSTKVPRLYEVKDERHAQAFQNQVSLAKEHALPLEERIAVAEKNAKSNDLGPVMKGQGGSREISFISHSLPEGKSNSGFGQKRGIQSLRLKPERQPFKGGGRGRSRGRGRGRGSGGRRGRSSSRGRGRW
eukprot:Gb_40390 [translate_table: standard]